MSEDNPNTIIDLEKNSKDLNINAMIYVRILRKAFEQSKADIKSLEAALEADDFEKAQAISHRLKGDYANMRIDTLSAIAKEMNDITKADKNKERLMTLLADFRNHFRQLEEFMDQQKSS